MLTEQLKLMAIEQSTRQIEFQLQELEGLVNRLLAGRQEEQTTGGHLQHVHSQIERELKNINYVIKQGQYPVSDQQLAIGQKVQEALIEINQI